MGNLTRTKKYRKYVDHASGLKFYVPIYQGRDVLLSAIPHQRWMYTVAEEAQDHAERYEKKKRAQNKRFNDMDYRGEVVARYARFLQKHHEEQEQEVKERNAQIEADIAARKEDE